jgi:predicted ATPase/DNA-binding CsgD family transcriptional regulator
VGVDQVTRPTGRLHSLTHARTSFVGRSDAVDKVAGLLARYRLVTVTGPGGVGKTRLADEVLKQVAGRFADGVEIVELAAVQDPAQLVPSAVATVLGVRKAAGVSLVDALVARLSGQQVLLVLDNCEQVLEATGHFCESVLLAADDIRILATSREPLGLPEEARYRLPPLRLPGRDAPGHASEAEAVALFVERAGQLDPDFTLNDDSGTMVARLVQRLDGMPLAIELAAARVEALGLAQLLDRLDDRFRLLISANRAAVARQRSLEATVDWSYQLLSEAEQRVFRCLSVFPGPFTLEAAEAVAGADAGPSVLRLVDCSLLLPPTTGPDGRSRYTMLETLRGYGMNRLREAGEEREAAGALTAHALRVAEQAAAQMALCDSELPAALWLDAEDSAVHQGLAWALDHDLPGALRLAVALAPWWELRGRQVQGSGLLQRVLQQTGPEANAWYSAHIWLCRLSALGGSDYGPLIDRYTMVVDALREGPPSGDLVDALAGRSVALGIVGPLADATADAHAALELARQINYASGEAMALAALSVIFLYADDGEQAVKWARLAQRIDQDRMPGRLVRYVQRILLFALVGTGLYGDDTPDACAQALAQAKAVGDPVAQAGILHLMTSLAVQSGHVADARTHLRGMAELETHIGNRIGLIDVLEEGGYLCAATGRYAEAVTLWSARRTQIESAGGALTPQEAHRLERPLQEAERALGAVRFKAADDRGAAITLTAAVELAVLMTGENIQAPTAPAGQGKLSARERELVTLVAQGRTDAEIAERLFISVSTVRTHLDRIRDKSGYRRRADLTRLALQEGII